MKKFLNAFVKDEDGAVTVDWVVLTAAIVGIALAILVTIGDALDNTANNIADAIGTALT
ncbi:MAG: hypothetical protein L3J05_10455 [Robiginitomaculum sp.]|nr:hypothetical protein [Robiginitomaculum sp.]